MGVRGTCRRSRNHAHAGPAHPPTSPPSSATPRFGQQLRHRLRGSPRLLAVRRLPRRSHLLGSTLEGVLYDVALVLVCNENDDAYSGVLKSWSGRPIRSFTVTWSPVDRPG